MNYGVRMPLQYLSLSLSADRSELGKLELGRVETEAIFSSIETVLWWFSNTQKTYFLLSLFAQAFCEENK